MVGHLFGVSDTLACKTTFCPEPFKSVSLSLVCLNLLDFVPYSRLGEENLLITTENPAKRDEGPSVKYIFSNKTDAPASHFIELYAMRWRVETFFRDVK